MSSINGESFGKYKILSEIGKGGMGEVYLAQDTKLNRKVTIKFLADNTILIMRALLPDLARSVNQKGFVPLWREGKFFFRSEP